MMGLGDIYIPLLGRVPGILWQMDVGKQVPTEWGGITEAIFGLPDTD